MWDRIFGAEEYPLEVDGQAVIPIFAGCLQHWLVDADASVVDQHVNPPVLIEGRLHHGLDLLFVRYVAVDKEGVAARLADLLGRLLARFLVPVDDHNLGAFFGEDLGNSPADALARTGDDGNFVFKFHSSAS